MAKRNASRGIVSRDPPRSFAAGGLASRTEVSAVSAGVPLYKRAQEMEQLSRTAADRKKNATAINVIEKELSDPRFVADKPISAYAEGAYIRGLIVT